MLKGLTKKQLMQSTERLLKHREQLAQQAEEESHKSRQGAYRRLVGEVHNSGEESVAEQLTGLDAELADRHLAALHEVDAALERIEQETYGICIDCGQLIGIKRLQAYPMAKRCIQCKQKFEREYVGMNTPSL